MREISPLIGENIRFYRKRLKLTQQELGQLINKGKATVAKYESGQILLDVQTLYELSQALSVSMDQLLYVQDEVRRLIEPKEVPNFFKDVGKLYVYYYDGRNKSLNESVMIINQSRQEDAYEAKLYYNVEDVDRYQLCEYTYIGRLVHYDVVSIFTLQNRTMAMEELKIIIPSAYNDESEKYAHFTGVSSRPLMPVTFKILVSKRQKKRNAELMKQLKLTKYDIQMLKFYNMFTVT